MLLLASSSVLDGVLRDFQSPEIPVGWESGHHFQVDFFVTMPSSGGSHPFAFTHRSILYQGFVTNAK